MKKFNRTSQIIIVVAVIGLIACVLIGAGAGVAVWLLTGNQSGANLTSHSVTPVKLVAFATQTVAPATVTPFNTSVPTETPAATSTPKPTFTPAPTATPTEIADEPRPEPRTDIGLCDVELDAAYTGTYVQWTGMVMSPPVGGQFQVWWENPEHIAQGFDFSGECSYGAFFVNYRGSERLYDNDIVVVTGEIIDTAYEYAGGGGSRQYGIVVQADEVVILNKLN